MIIYHNPRCGKSRNALQALQNHQCEVIEYLKNPLSVEELKSLSKKLGLPPSEFVRKKEPVYHTLFGNHKPSDEEIYLAISQNPILLERPIVVKGNQAWIVRSEEAIQQLQK
jgi:arsenate reductase